MSRRVHRDAGRPGLHRAFSLNQAGLDLGGLHQDESVQDGPYQGRTDALHLPPRQVLLLISKAQRQAEPVQHRMNPRPVNPRRILPALPLSPPVQALACRAGQIAPVARVERQPRAGQEEPEAQQGAYRGVCRGA